MINFLKINLLDPQVQYQIGRATRKCLIGIYQVAPKRAMGIYGGFAACLSLWVLVSRSNLPNSIKLPLIASSVAGLAVVHNELDKYALDIDEQKNNDLEERATISALNSSYSTTKNLAATQFARIELSKGLPEYIKEPDLQSPEFKERNIPNNELTVESLVADYDKRYGSADKQIDSSDNSPLKFFKRKNKNTGAEETCVDLEGMTKYCGLKIENVAKLMAESDIGCLGIGPTGTGKSGILKRAIYEQHKLDEVTDFVLLAHKSENANKGGGFDYCGLEKSQDCIVFSNSMAGYNLVENGTKLLNRLSIIESQVESGEDHPVVVAIDQFNSGLNAATKLDKFLKRNKAQKELFLKERYNEIIETIITDGREKLVKPWIFAHGDTNDITGLDHQIKLNLAYLGLGGSKDGNYNAITTVLKSDRFITDNDKRNELGEKLKKYQELHKKSESPVNVVIAITNLGAGGWRLVVIPQPIQLEPIELGPQNPPNDKAIKDQIEALMIDDDDIKNRLMNVDQDIESGNDEIIDDVEPISGINVDPQTKAASEGYDQYKPDEDDKLKSFNAKDIIKNTMSNKEALGHLVDCFNKLQPGVHIKLHEFLSGKGKKLSSKYQWRVENLKIILIELHKQGRVDYPNMDMNYFTIL